MNFLTTIQITLSCYFTVALCYAFIMITDNPPEWGKILFGTLVIISIPGAIVGTYMTIWLWK